MAVNKADRAEVIALRQSNPFASLQQIADTLPTPISRERVRQILARAKVETKAARVQRLCGICEKPLKSNQPKHCSLSCRHQASITKAICSNCGKLFTIQQSQLYARINRNSTNNLFCSNYCMGQSHGKNYGFYAHPENIKTPKRSGN